MKRSLALVSGLALATAPISCVPLVTAHALAQAPRVGHTIAAGGGHSLVVKADGTLWAFGSNEYGQLGVPRSPDGRPYETAPVKVMSGVAQVAAGQRHSLVLKTDGTLWTFGSNLTGALGTATNAGTSRPNPNPVQIMRGVSQIAAGGWHSLVVKTDGTLWSFGSNSSGQLGTAARESPNPEPLEVMRDVARVAAGGDHSLVLKTDGTVWSFGANNAGQLGTLPTGSALDPNGTPVLVLRGAADLAAGSAHSLVVKADGTLWAFGSNTAGQLGTTTSPTTAPSWVPIRVMENVRAIAAGGTHSLAVMADGSLAGFGDDSSGQLALATDPSSSDRPRETPNALTRVIEVATGSGHSLAVTDDGMLWAFGLNTMGQLGVPPSESASVSTPRQVMTGVARIAAAGDYFEHSLALKRDGTLWSFGVNNAGQLGTPVNRGTWTPNPNPHQVMSGVAQIAAGDQFSLAVTTDGTLWTFGDNRWGQLGRSGDGSATPTQVMTGVARVAAGAYHSLVLKNDGTLWTFGNNESGQLGNPATSGSRGANPTPTRVMSDVAQIAAGSAHSLALKTDGTLWAFGANSSGALGTGTLDRSSPSANPIPVQVMSDVAFIAAGGGDSFAVKTDATLWGFGWNGTGQLAIAAGTLGVSTVATPTHLISGVASVAAGGWHSLVVKTDGTLWSFGSNREGQLGRYTPYEGQATAASIATQPAALATGRAGTAAYAVPATVPGPPRPNPSSQPTQVMAGVARAAASGRHSLVVKTDDTLWSFGSNHQGQLGTTENVASDLTYGAKPVAVMSGLAVTAPPVNAIATRPAAFDALCTGQPAGWLLSWYRHWLISLLRMPCGPLSTASPTRTATATSTTAMSGPDLLGRTAAEN